MPCFCVRVKKEKKMVLSQELEIFNHLKELECCTRCILHHLRVDEKHFHDPTEYLNQLNKNLDENNLDESESKKQKKNICRLCLDMLQDEMIDQFVEAVNKKSDINEYQFNNFKTFVSVPKSVLIRRHGMAIYLKEKYPDFFKSALVLETTSKIFKYTISKKLEKVLNRTLSGKSNFEISLNIEYKNDDKEVKNVYNLNKSKFQYKNKRKSDFISRNYILEILSDVTDSLFKENFDLLPSLPSEKVTLKEIVLTSSPMYIGGRYLKFTRDLCQTPWIINKKKVKENCVQDIVFEALENILGKQNKMTLVASGREDADVRMLGTGRPFYIQIDNPKTHYILNENYRLLEKAVISTKLMAVSNLQTIYRSDINRIKDGEQNKQKTYLALCKTDAEDVNEVVYKLNNYGEVELNQKTPIRVLHRRTQSIRKRFIYSMKARTVPGHTNIFELECITQAGTYVKEFVHGDFERTSPNVGTITGHPCDILTLDVLNIDLEWPECKK